MVQKKRIIHFSGGKNSTAMLLRMIELDVPFDEIRYFDCGNWEFPQMHKHINKIEQSMKIRVNRLKYKYGFDHLFQKYGFPELHSRWCTGRKMNTLNKGTTEKIKYIGYTIDEKNRADKIQKRLKNCRFPLIKEKWNDNICLDYCYSKGFDWDGLYEIFPRVSCWCCPFQSLTELKNLRKYFPLLWQRLLQMQKQTNRAFRMDKIGVFDLEKRFAQEDKQLLLWVDKDLIKFPEF